MLTRSCTIIHGQSATWAFKRNSHLEFGDFAALHVWLPEGIPHWADEHPGYQAFEPEPYWANNPRWNPSIDSWKLVFSSQFLFNGRGAAVVWSYPNGYSGWAWGKWCLECHPCNDFFGPPKIHGNAMIGTWNTSSTGFQPNTLMKPMDHRCNLIIFNQQKSLTVAIEPS